MREYREEVNAEKRRQASTQGTGALNGGGGAKKWKKKLGAGADSSATPA